MGLRLFRATCPQLMQRVSNRFPVDQVKVQVKLKFFTAEKLAAIKINIICTSLTVNLEHMFGASLQVEVIYALSDDHHGAALLLQAGLTLCDSLMCRIGLLTQDQLTPVVVELPDLGRMAGKGFWGCQILRGRGVTVICAETPA